MKTFRRLAELENIGADCELYKQEMYNYLVSLYQGQVTEEEHVHYIKSLIKNQNDMGFWGFVKPEKVGADIRVLYFYEPTYIATAIMMIYWNEHRGNVEAIPGFEEAFKRGLNAAIGRPI